MEKAEIITHLSKMLNSYQVYVHKSRYFSWNVIGQDHFELKQRFLTCHEKGSDHMNRIAARLGLFNYSVTDNWQTILKTSEIQETTGKLTGFEMVKSIVGDLLILLSIQTDCVKKANELDDYGTEFLIRHLISELEKEYLDFICWLK
ncbi:MAG TPA: ferritin-like domain-containing protein [Bacteroidales bacterium]|nr:ferritin-like domain-containing protein [Bacteroidales bacterium]